MGLETFKNTSEQSDINDEDFCVEDDGNDVDFEPLSDSENESEDSYYDSDSDNSVGMQSDSDDLPSDEPEEIKSVDYDYTIVSIEKLKLLFVRCVKCGSTNETLKFTTKGAMLCVTSKCTNYHTEV
jgi:hypothetical protein